MCLPRFRLPWLEASDERNDADRHHDVALLAEVATSLILIHGDRGYADAAARGQEAYSKGSALGATCAISVCLWHFSGVAGLADDVGSWGYSRRTADIAEATRMTQCGR
jgi:hypothetical protein